MKDFQKILLVFISIALLTGCQDNSQNPQPKRIKHRNITIPNESERIKYQDINISDEPKIISRRDEPEIGRYLDSHLGELFSLIRSLDTAQNIHEEINNLFSFLIPTAQAESEKEYKNLRALADDLKKQVKDGALEKEIALKQWNKAHKEFIRKKESKIMAKITIIARKNTELAEKMQEYFNIKRSILPMAKELKKRLKNKEITKEEFRSAGNNLVKNWLKELESWKDEYKVIINKIKGKRKKDKKELRSKVKADYITLEDFEFKEKMKKKAAERLKIKKIRTEYMEKRAKRIERRSMLRSKIELGKITHNEAEKRRKEGIKEFKKEMISMIDRIGKIKNRNNKNAVIKVEMEMKMEMKEAEEEELERELRRRVRFHNWGY
jgi:hypothetical protein